MIMMPSWRMPGSDARTWTSAELKGSTYVMYFYPKDQTPGCTIQACEFRDNLARLQAAGIKVFGVSPDSLASHHKFAAKEKLTFPLLTDNDHSLATKLGVWAEKSLYGRTFPGIERTTFLIGPEGAIIGEWRKVKVAGHVAEVVSAATGVTVPPPAVAQVPPAPPLPPAGAKPAMVTARPIAVLNKSTVGAIRPTAPAAKPVAAAPQAAKPAVVEKVIAKPVAAVKAVVKAVVKTAAKAVDKAKPAVKAVAAKAVAVKAVAVKAVAVKAVAVKAVAAKVKPVAKAKPAAKPAAVKAKPKR